VCECKPPRRSGEGPRSELGLAASDSPLRARSLLTVAAAMRSAIASSSPRCSRLSLMCSYWRSRLSVHFAFGMSIS